MSGIRGLDRDGDQANDQSEKTTLKIAAVLRDLHAGMEPSQIYGVDPIAGHYADRERWIRAARLVLRIDWKA